MLRPFDKLRTSHGTAMLNGVKMEGRGPKGDFKAVPIGPVAVLGERGCMLIGLTGVSDPGYSESSRYD